MAYQLELTTVHTHQKVKKKAQSCPFCPLASTCKELLTIRHFTTSVSSSYQHFNIPTTNFRNLEFLFSHISHTSPRLRLISDITMLLRLFSFLLLATTFAAAQFGSFFEQMFQGGDDHDHQHHHHQQNDVPSDSAWFQKTYNGAHCSKYLCPNTLACVDKPLHCPCAFDKWEVKFEVQDGLPLCLSKSGHPKMTEKKVELARKGLL